MGGVKSWLFGWLNVEEILHCIGDHGQGESWQWVRCFNFFEELLDHVGRKGVKKDGASLGTGDGLLP